MKRRENRKTPDQQSELVWDALSSLSPSIFVLAFLLLCIDSCFGCLGISFDEHTFSSSTVLFEFLVEALIG